MGAGKGSLPSQLSCLPQGYYMLVAKVRDREGRKGHQGSTESEEAVQDSYCF